ncbi:MAG TPA: hypothetical protein VLW85_24105 [Myxococcales bacterium]|nr:hypothetical protein [Myxococcales bacterium]
MGARKLAFPIALAILWVLMTAMAMADFASFNASTQPQQHSVRVLQGRASRIARE